MVNIDPYPQAPGDSGSAANIAKLLGVGAYTIDDANEGSGLSYGQGVGTDTFVKSLIYSVAMGMGTGDGTINSALTNLGTYLQTMPLDSLKLLQPYVPNTTQADFSTVEGGVEKVLEMFQMGSGSLNVDDFNNWVESIFDPNGQLWQQGKAWWDSVIAALDNYPPYGSSAATVAVWWSNLFTALGLDAPSAALLANIISGNYDWAKQSKAWLDQILAGLGLSNGTQIASQIYTAGATANGAKASADQQLAWAKRKSQNEKILWDWTFYYPQGSPSDTANTLVGGKRTKWGAFNDNIAIFTEQWGFAPPTTGFVDPAGKVAATDAFAQDTQTRVIINEDTLAQVQADVDALKTADTSVAGRKYVATAAGGSSASWGPQWSVTATNGNIAPKSETALFSMTLAASSSVDLKLAGVFTGGVTLTDDQRASLVFQDAATNMAGGFGPQNTLKARMSSDGQNYIWARVNFNRITLGYCVGGVETIWDTKNSVSVPAGTLLELACGSSAGHRNYQVKVGGKVVITYAESGTSSMMGASYRGGGHDMSASHGIANDTFAPARIKQFKLQDSAAAASTYGSSARWSRTGAAISFSRGSVQSLGGQAYDTMEYSSPDIELALNGFAIYTPGRYRITHGAKVSANSSTWTALASGPTYYGSVNQITYPGPNVISRAASGFSTAACTGVFGTFSFNALGDGAATELWAPSIGIGGAGNAWLMGDGTGEGTWVTIERID